MTQAQADRIERLTDAFSTFGYVVVAEPIAGSETLFADTLRDALASIQQTFSANAVRYGYRGRSRNALSALHAAIPHPCFGVEVAR